MHKVGRYLRQLGGDVFTLRNLPAAVAVVVIALAGAFVEAQTRAVFLQNSRNDTSQKLNVVRAKLEGHLGGNLQLVRGLVATLITEPDMSQERFAALARHVVTDDSFLKIVAAAPDLVVKLIYPVEGNEAVLGVDYNDIADQREPNWRARDSGDPVLAGPVDLVQGGTGFIGRFPVFIDRLDGDPRFWGIISAIIDVDRLYRETGLLDPDLPIEIAILGRDGLGERGGQFFGRPEILSSEPVMADVLLPSGRWRLAAIPSGGWEDTPPMIWVIRLLTAVLAGLVFGPMVVMARLARLRSASLAELKTAHDRIEHNAHHDSLTGLPNRRFLDVTLEARDEAAKAPAVALLHLDLDRFKQINDTLGHSAGDAMLRHAANMLRKLARPDDFVARVAGDEFVMLCDLSGIAREKRTAFITNLADAIIEAMRRPLNFEGHDCRCGASIGIAILPEEVRGSRRMMVNADIALYRAKKSGRNRCQFFNDTLEAEIVHTKRTADQILIGLERSQFIPHYQPQFDAVTLEVIGVEALVRWQHPTAGLLMPASFLKIAEELDVVAMIDGIILEKALADFDDWRSRGVDVPKLSVNVSARRLQEETLVASLKKLSFRPGSLSFELLESIFLDESEELVAWNINQIRELGIDIEIDDFGTGYASIVSVMKLRPQRLKIDRQIIQPITCSETQRQLVGSIIDIGRSMDIDVLAEGVETREHAAILRQLGCQGLQGHAFARPMAASELVQFLRSKEWRAAS